MSAPTPGLANTSSSTRGTQPILVQGSAMWTVGVTAGTRRMPRDMEGAGLWSPAGKMLQRMLILANRGQGDV